MVHISIGKEIQRRSLYIHKKENMLKIWPTLEKIRIYKYLYTNYKKAIKDDSFMILNL